MGREIVYCWKCATRLQGTDFDDGKAFRIGDKVSCPGCVDELVADLSAEEQEAILNPPKEAKSKTGGIKKISSTDMKAVQKEGGTAARRPGTTARQRTGTTGPVPRVRTGTTGPVPTASTGVRKKVTASIPKVQPPADEEGGDEAAAEGGEKPPMDEKKKRLLLIGGIGGGLFLVIVVLLILVLTKKEPPKKTHEETAEDPKQKTTAPVSVETPKEKEVKARLKEAFDLKKDRPEALGLQLRKFREAETAAEGTSYLPDVKNAIEDLLVKLDKAVADIGEQVKPQYTAYDYKAVLEAYEKAKALHDVPEWIDRLDTKIKLVKNKPEDTLHQFKKAIETARESGEDAKIEEKREIIKKWEMPEILEKFEKFLSLLAAADPSDPAKTSDTPRTPAANLNVRTLTPAMKSFMPVWQSAVALAFGRDYAAAATEMSGAAARADSDEAKKAATEDVDVLKAIGERYQEFLKVAAETPKLTALTLEYQDKPGEWKKVTGKTLKVDPTRLEFQPDTPKDGKAPAPILIEFTDLNAGSLAALYKARKKTLPKKDADLLTKFALLEGAAESAQSIGGSAPDRYWVHATEARDKAPKPNSREFEARILFHQSEFEWRKMVTRYTAIEKSKQLLGDYSGSLIVRKYQPAIKERAEYGKEYVFLPAQLNANGDYNVFKNTKKDDPAWIAAKGIDFKDSLFNYVEAEFIALPGLTYRCWVYAGGCCQEVWNGSYQVSEGTTKNRGKDVPIDPGSQMAAPLPYPSGLKKTHDEHKPKPEKGSKTPPEHPKTPAKWDWISIPMPKAFAAPGAKAVRILTDQQGFGVKYVIISSSRPKPPDEATAKDLAKEAVAAPGGKPEIRGTAEPKEWFLIGPFPDGLTNEQAPEKEVDLTKDYKGKTANVRWKLASATIKGTQAQFDWEKGPFNPKDAVSVYAMIHVKAPAAMEARLLLSHDDGGRAWVNGQLVHDKNKSGAVKADEFNVAIKLEEGWNRILFKVNNVNDKFGLIMRITDGGKAAIPGLEYSPYGDMLEPP